MLKIREQYRHNRMWSDIKESFWKCVITVAVLTLVAVVISALIINDRVNSLVISSNQRVEINNLVDNARVGPSGREQAARSILQLDKSGLSKIVSNASGGSEQIPEITQALEHVQKTGQLLRLTSQIEDWHYWRSEALPVILGSGLAILSLVLFIMYNIESADEYYLLDLEWKRIWPIFFIAFTALPIGLPFYVVSGIRLQIAKKKQLAERSAEAARLQRRLEQRLDEVAPVLGERNRANEVEVVNFHSAPNAAKQHYILLREKFSRSGRAEMVLSLESSRDNCTTRLQDLGKEVLRIQDERNEVMAELIKLRSVMNAEEPLDPMQLAGEFEILVSLPGVKGVRVINDEISIWVEARIEWESQSYDLGDWDLRFGKDYSLYAIELRSGVRRGWSRGYPVYRLSDNQFCFGDRQPVINDNVLKGQFLQAVEVAVNSLCSVNREDRALIPDAFEREVVTK